MPYLPAESRAAGREGRGPEPGVSARMPRKLLFQRVLWQKLYKHRLHVLEEEAAHHCLDCFLMATCRQDHLFLASYEASIAVILAFANFWDMQTRSSCFPQFPECAAISSSISQDVTGGDR